MSADFSDQTGIFDPNSCAESVTIIGCGGIGGSILPTIVTMGFQRFVLYDDDLVEPRNMASTLIFTDEHLYQPKVEVVRDYLLAHGAEEVVIHREKFTAATEIDSSVVISGVDTMAARQEIWQAVAVSDAVDIYLDGRIGGLNWHLLLVNPLDGEWYENKHLFGDDKAAEDLCAVRAIVYPAVALGAQMAAQLAKWSRHVMIPKQLRGNMEDGSQITIGTQLI